MSLTALWCDRFVRLDPLEGAALDGQNQAPEAPPVRLAAARGAAASFQLLVGPVRGGREALVGPGGLASPSGARIAASQFDVFVEWYHAIDGKWWPDALVPQDSSGGIHHQTHPVQALRKRGGQVLCVGTIQALVGFQRHRYGLRALVETLENIPFNGVLLLVRKFEAGVAHHLDAVVLVRIMRSRDHHAGGERAGTRYIGDARSGDQAGKPRLHAPFGKPSRNVLRQPFARLARVHSDDDFRIQVMAADPTCQCDAHRVRSGRVQRRLSGHTSNSIRAK
jgi:hypothetical protein